MDENLTEVSELSTELSWVELPDTAKTWRFRGELLAEVSTETRHSPRWTTMQLFKITAGQYEGQYMVSVTGRSVIYHQVGSTCNSGVPTKLMNVPSDAEPCRICVVDSELVHLVRDVVSDSLEVNLEEDWHHVERCEDSPAVLAALKRRRGKVPSTGEMSRPAVRLLQLAALRDPVFDAQHVVDEL